MNLKPYPEYKDSGVQWLGKVPKHWEVHLLKRVSRFAYGDSLSNEKRINGDVPVFGSNGKVGSHNSANTKSPVIIIGRKGSYGKLNYSKLRSFVIDTAYFIDESQTQTPLRWLFYALSSLDLDTQSKDAAVPGLSRDDAYRKIIFVPTLAEQTAIARFLDYKTAQIARFIKAKKRMIELLKEQKQAIINDAVTGKIDVTTGKPYPKYKDSGVKWLGKVPERWEVRKIKYIKSNTPNSFVDGPFGSSLKSIHYVQNSDVYIVESGFITRGQFIWKDFKTITNKHFATIKRSECKGGDIIIAKIGAYYGMSGILPELDKKAVVSGNSLKLTINHSICNVEYIHYALLVAKNKSAFKFIVGETAQPALSLGGINRICLPLPNMNEQLEITKVIKNKSRILDLTISRTEREIALMQEYRTRLISDVVTGKVDVRDIKIPDIAGIDATIDESIDEPEGEEELETEEAEE